MNFEGIVRLILAEELIGTQQLRKRTVVLDEAGDNQYKGSIAIDFFNDKIDLLNDLRPGDAVRVSLNVKAREYNGKRYNGLTWRKIEKTTATMGNTVGWATEASSADDFPF